MSVPATLLTPPPSQRSSMARLHTRVFFPGEASKAYAVSSATPLGLRGASPPSMMAPHTAGVGRHTGGPKTHSSSHRLQILAHAEPSRLRRPCATDLLQGAPQPRCGTGCAEGAKQPPKRPPSRTPEGRGLPSDQSHMHSPRPPS